MSEPARAAPVLGVLVPCRNERAVIGRKLANLGQQAWPAAPRPHALVIVDDQSDDDTAGLATEALARGFDPATSPHRPALHARVVTNEGRPGKAGAMLAGLAALAELRVDVIVLTDADVVFESGALLAVAHAFAAARPPGMACGSQRFVDSLAPDGRPAAADGSAPQAAAGLYDRLTAVVRRWESRRGRLFSVHGQLLAWRADLGLSPTPGIAADDLDLMRQVRTQGEAVVKLDDARFLEVKTPPGADRRSQQSRRARAYFQVIGRCRLPPPAPLLDRLQFAAYRVLPAQAPRLAVLVALLPPALGALLDGGRGAAWGAALSASLVSSPPGRRLVRLLAVIAASQRAEAAEPLPDRWEMTRR